MQFPNCINSNLNKIFVSKVNACIGTKFSDFKMKMYDGLHGQNFVAFARSY